MSQTESTVRLLLVEDDAVDQMAVKRALKKAPFAYELEIATSVATGLEMTREGGYDCAIVDYALPDGTAVEFLAELAKTERRVATIILTGLDDQATALGALERGAQDYLLKSEIGSGAITRSIHYALARQRVSVLERRLVDADRLSAIGQLAAGVAHEVNNPACFILANLSFIRDCLGDVRSVYDEIRGAGGDHPELAKLLSGSKAAATLTETLAETESAVADCIQGTERICRVVSELKPFSRIEHSEVEELNVNGILETALSIANNEIRHRATLVKELAELPTIVGDRSKLTEVFVSLATNAAHAIEEGASEQNTITVRSRVLGDSISIDFIDTGVGIPPEKRAHIFEPFYTTKAREIGTGLGLAIAAETVRKHGGEISLDSAIGLGTTFTVRIPIETALARPSQNGAKREGATDLNARVLLIDDDKMVRSGLRRLLTPPHDVVEAESGGHALEVLADDRFFDVIICDLMMPEVDGPTVYAALKKSAPDLLRRIVFLTGGAFTPRVKEFMATVEAPVLQKPIGRKRLLEAVASISGAV